MKLTKTTKVTKALILTGVLTFSMGTLSGCGSKEVSQPKTEAKVQAESIKKVEVHGADVVKENLLQFLQMDSEEAISFAKKNISDEITLEESDGKINRYHTIDLESDHKGLKIVYFHNRTDKSNFVAFKPAEHNEKIAKSIEDAQRLLSQYGISPKWEKSTQKGDVPHFVSNIEGKPVNILVVTAKEGNTRVVGSIHVDLKE
ncbi:hypothetical protein bcgnr5372_38830 [Bacillus luti]|nr:hypothetical protein [Bacillus cereus]HDR8330716.1 hypothetical protein [Bacillus cereus]HDR8336453.1 hypothetical protein [Bacillus cereus]